MPTTTIAELLREDLRGRVPYGAPQLDVPVRLNTNENAFPVPQAVVEAALAALREELPGLNRYPDREFTALREAICAYLGRQAGVRLDPSMIWAGNGSNEVLAHLVQAFGGPGRVALGFTPAYSMHPIIAQTHATRWVDGPRDPRTFAIDIDAAVAQVQAVRPHLVFLCSPNNPTGTALELATIEAVLAADDRCVVVVDEAYAEFARPGTRGALELLAAGGPGAGRLVVTRTMSKAFAFAGGRLGYLAAGAELVDALRLVRLPYHLATPTQVIARVALEHADALLAGVAELSAQRDTMVAALAALGYPPVPSDANFVLFGGLADQTMTWRALLERGVLVRDVGLPGYLRVTAGTAAETSAFLDAMAALGPEHRKEDAG